MDWSAAELTGETFAEAVKHPDHPVFIDFWAAWCPPCRMMDPVIKQLAAGYKEKVAVRKLNTDRYPGIAQELNVSGIPTFIIFKQGKEVWRKVGAVSKKKLEEVFKEILDV